MDRSGLRANRICFELAFRGNTIWCREIVSIARNAVIIEASKSDHIGLSKKIIWFKTALGYRSIA